MRLLKRVDINSMEPLLHIPAGKIQRNFPSPRRSSKENEDVTKNISNDVWNGKFTGYHRPIKRTYGAW